MGRLSLSCFFCWVKRVRLGSVVSEESSVSKISWRLTAKTFVPALEMRLDLATGHDVFCLTCALDSFGLANIFHKKISRSEQACDLESS